jgi:GH25 family lysozyme M1 (1,4-beta-N-acetylmuramidase)
MKLSLFGRDVRFKVIHGLGLVAFAAVVMVVLIFVVGIFASFEYPYKTKPAPKVPSTQTVPNCANQPPSQHRMGGCLPTPTHTASALITQTNVGVDFSNHNPIDSQASWNTIAKHTSFAFVKVSEGTGYTDPTAKGMVVLAKRAGLIVGGYDFLHICLVSAQAEATLFVSDERADGLTGKKILPGVGDAEYPNSPQCNVRSWLTTWSNIVHKLSGVWPTIYTGAWWWDPYVGTFWVAHALSWIAGYVPRASLPIPSGLSHLDIWQNTDNGYNGVSYSDMSAWLAGVSEFQRVTGTTPPTPPKPTPPPAPKPTPATAKMVYKTPITVSRKGVVVLTAGCSIKPCVNTSVFRAEVGKGKKNPVLLRWKHDLAVGRTGHPKFTLPKSVLSTVRKHQVKVSISTEKHQVIVLRRLT